ncbi:OCIA domain-containing protein 1 [Trichoplax sp. H2]|uniref:OCIA domain-containing protein n=1 Tax=Trichoplax adhaerens TaxID=10228 RepID=B3RKG8_TRIAD|nr:hypothetical protein TRIADDRAFT_51675 [Trichoplax adhaerens]EDV28597.1 hypothetical protein TRIADDRAFT_51675 [Trichoplax adhaerens]RDD44710.1 OCIA domain-containing protein 1 [Trichoplax sp. H2]|eukprot:XP_002107799.1 hypothetical protein TRIADDRAFT_51675 [Trichoplax adhaerens]
MSNRGEEMPSEDASAKVSDVEYDKRGLPRLTPQEEAVLRECRSHSLYYRGIPLGIISVVITRRAAASSPHIHRWRAFYYVGIFGLSLLTGIASYRRQCMAKILQLENSPLADRLKEQLKGHSPYQRLHQWQQHQQDQNNQATLQQGGQPVGSLSPRSTSSFDSNRENYKDREELPAFRNKPYDDLKLGTNTTSTSAQAAPLAIWDDDEKPDRRQQVSYSDLRQQNRTRWAENDDRKQRGVPESMDKNSGSSSMQGKQDGFRKPVRTNKYGDPIDE